MQIYVPTLFSSDVAELEELHEEIDGIAYGLDTLLEDGSMVFTVNGEDFTVTDDNILSQETSMECPSGKVWKYSYCGKLSQNKAIYGA